MAGISYVLAHTEDARRVSTRRLTYAALALVAAFLCFIVLPKPAVAANYPVTISATTFPDEAFRQYVINNITGGSMTLTQTRAEAVSYIGVISRGVNTLRGIEFFPNLKTLDCDNNNLTALDLSKNTALTLLACQNNNLASLDVSKNIALGQLACSNNNLTSLDLSKNTALTYLSCENNNLASLNISKNIALRHLICSSNNLTALDVSKNTALMYLFCGNNKLTSLDVSRNTVLTSLFCYDNNLTALDLSKNTALTEFNCSNNNLTSLDVSKNTALDYLFCRNNNLTSLDVSKNTALRTLSCYGNSLIELDLSKNPNLRTDVFLAIAQTRTIPLIPDPASPGSYMSKDTYTFAAGHSITVASATYRTDTKRFYTSTPNKALTFTTNIGSGRTVSGTVTFTDTTAPKLTANTGTRSATATGIAKFTSDEAGTY
ncbi:MAG: hypothetical protein LBU31_01635, partial [Coriobacteriales bacterium]|nr:hypothetical protein [Coriobacteriales bacterium]